MFPPPPSRIATLPPDPWPPLPVADWAATLSTLHMCCQMVGKVRLALTPPVNHFWNVALRLTSRGLTTTPMYFDGGARVAQIDFDLVDHNLIIDVPDAGRRVMPLLPRAVAETYRELMQTLDALGVDVPILDAPVEVADPIPFHEDHLHAAYDPAAVRRLLQVLHSVRSAFQALRGRFVGKASPIHFFWGSFDLAMTWFNGRRTDARAGADRITREAYSHECISFGFWPGAPGVADALVYSYAVPEPPGYPSAHLPPGPARYHARLGELVLPYDELRAAPDPRRALLAFLDAAYEAGAALGKWDRAALESTSGHAALHKDEEQPLPPEGAGQHDR